ncbi:MAG TPA: tetratricopeptide repeat protein, partial [Gemmatimonadaceae bacterium]|nr:tetratricopeptide repeat protein [Gemmatimonadaceae bacterium]
MAVTPVIVSLLALLISATACQDSTPSAKPSAPGRSVAQGTVAADDRDLVIRARALDRAEKRDSARLVYVAAAEALPVIADWLYLRAAGVTPDSSTRAEYYEKVRTPVARDRVRWTEALARERSGDIPGATRAYAAVGSRLDVLRLRLWPPVSDSAKAGVRDDLLAFLRTSGSSQERREVIAMFDRTYPSPTPAEQLAIARSAANSGARPRAAEGFAAAAKSGLLTASDNFAYGTVLFLLRRYADATSQFARVRNPPALTAAAQYQRARGQIATGNKAAARTTLRSITTDFPSDTSAAAALLLLADLATDENRDADARETLQSLVKRFPSGRHAATANFRSGLIAFINGNHRAAAADFDAVAS